MVFWTGLFEWNLNIGLSRSLRKRKHQIVNMNSDEEGIKENWFDLINCDFEESKPNTPSNVNDDRRVELLS
jgi:hypothetical protein